VKGYGDNNGDSGILAYEYGDDWIRVQFKHGGTYVYQASDIGSAHLNMMKRLADSGTGLTTYINMHPEVRDGYSRNWRRFHFSTQIV
jgi:hypothetical protein